MKRNQLIIISLLLFFVACEEADKDIKWGKSLLYMPQAILQSGGTDNNFQVSVDLKTANDTAIVVGLYRSGLEELNSVSVDLTVCADTLEKAIQIAQDVNAPVAYSIYKNARLLPSNYYSVPSKISLKDGQRESYVLLTIKKEELRNNEDFKSGTLFILPLRISNCTRYSINPSLSTTMFIFKVKS